MEGYVHGGSIDEWGREVKKRLIDEGMTIGDLAEVLEVTRTYTSLVINGKAKSENLRRGICELLDIPYSECSENG